MARNDIYWHTYWARAKGMKALLDSILRGIGFNEIIAKESIRTAYRLLSDTPCPVIVEAGCGTATLSLALINMLATSSALLVDISPEVLARIELRERVNVLQGDIYNMCVDSGYCHLCCNLGTIEHFGNPLPIVQEMARVSNKFVMCAVPAASLIWKGATLLRQLVEKDATLWTDHTYYHSKEYLFELFSQAGLQDIRIVEQTFIGLPFMHVAYGSKQNYL